jgi:hypothetical protein
MSMLSEQDAQTFIVSTGSTVQDKRIHIGEDVEKEKLGTDIRRSVRFGRRYTRAHAVLCC